MSFNYIASSQFTTAVQEACLCSLRVGSRDLVVAKGNRLELWRMSSDGDSLDCILESPVYGKIMALNKFRPSWMETDLLFILVEKKLFCILGWDDSKSKFISHAKGNVEDRVGTDRQTFSAMIDPNSRMIALQLKEGLLKVIPIDGGVGLGFKEAFNIRLEEQKVLDIKFLHGCIKSTICVLCENHAQNRSVRTYIVDAREKELTEGPWQFQNANPTSHSLVAVPSPTGGILVISSTVITYIGEGRDNVLSVAMPEAYVSALGAVDELGNKYLMGDFDGGLSLLSLEVESGKVVALSLDKLGHTSIPQSLCYIENGYAFVGSKFGDSQLVRLLDDPNETGDSLEIVQSFPNIGPILDMVTVQSAQGSQAQSQLVLCSGYQKDGSLRVVRAGIGMQEQASIEAPGLKGLWSLTGGTGVFDKFLIQSFIGETRVLVIEGEQLAEAEITGMSSEQSIFWCDVGDGAIIQVTGSSVRLLHVTLGLLEEILPEAGASFTVARSRGCNLVVADSSRQLTHIIFDPTSRKFLGKSSWALSHDVAALSIGLDSRDSQPQPSDGADMDMDMGQVSKPLLLAVGLWTENNILIYELASTAGEPCKQMEVVALEAEVQARDVMITSLENVMYLMVGLGDGVLLTYMLSMGALALPGNAGFVGPCRRIALGSRPIQLEPFSTGGSPCIFVCCDRPTIVYSRHGKLLFSVVNIPEVSCMAPFNCEMFPDCMTLASGDDLVIGTVDAIQKLHIQTHHFGHSVNRVVHHAEAGVLIVTGTRVMVDAITGTRQERDIIMFLNDTTFEEVHNYTLDEMELCQSAICCSLSPRTPAAEGTAGTGARSATKEVYVTVGTAFAVPTLPEPEYGRLLVFRITLTSESDSSSMVRKVVDLVTQTSVQGCVYSLAEIDGMLLAGINCRVLVYALTTSSGEAMDIEPSSAHEQTDALGGPAARSVAVPELQLQCQHSGQILALHVKTRGEYAVVGDLLRSISLLRLVEIEGTLKLVDIARDFGAQSMRAVGIIDDEFYVGAEDYGNLFFLRRALESASEEERRQLEITGEFHLGDKVNVMVNGSLNSQPVIEKAESLAGEEDKEADAKTLSRNTCTLFGTVGGLIGSCLHIDETTYRFFKALESAMTALIGSVGGFSHDDWRSFKSDRRSSTQAKNCIDGDLVETFLEKSKEEMEQLTRNVNDELGLMAAQIGQGGMEEEGSSSLPRVREEQTKGPYTVEEVYTRVEEMVQMH